MSFMLSEWIALLAIIIIGLPHGAFDGAVYGLWRARQSGAAAIDKSLFAFLSLYVFCALIVIGLWIALPVLSLACFLLISAYHFGTGDAQAATPPIRLTQIIAHGGLVTIWLPALHQDEVMRYFTLLSGEGAIWLMEAISVCVYLWLAAILYYAALAWREPTMRLRLLELLAIMGALSFMPVIVGFAFYFCAFHSARHFFTIWRAIHRNRAALPLALILTFASWAAGGMALWALSQFQDFTASIIQILFIGLAALTVPHMILIDGLWRPRRQSRLKKI